jgi:RNA polymerase sigma-70 factor (ECF subfamily)
MRAGEPRSSELDDAALVDRARGGDRRAYDALVHRYAPRVFGLVLRWMHDRDDAEEVAQTAFVRAWQALPKFHGGEEFRAWLFRIAVNAANDELRARKRHRPVRMEDVDEAELDAAAGTAPDPAEAARAARLGERLDTALARLSEEHRAVLLLRAREEMSYAEIAATLKIPAGTVMSRLARARKELRALLENPNP